MQLSDERGVAAFHIDDKDSDWELVVRKQGYETKRVRGTFAGESMNVTVSMTPQTTR